MRSASREDRRYLLYNPIVKMKVTTEGEEVDRPPVGRDRGQGLREGHVLRDGRPRHPGAAEARGHGPRQHRADRQVHAELLLRPAAECRRSGAATTTPTTTSCSTRGRPAASAKIQFHDYRPAFERFGHLPNVATVHGADRRLPRAAHDRHADRGAAAATSTSCWRSASCSRWSSTRSWCSRTRRVYSIPDELVDEIFDVFVRDFSAVRARPARQGDHLTRSGRPVPGDAQAPRQPTTRATPPSGSRCRRSTARTR